MEIADKLAVLSKVGQRLNGEGVTWAVGASLMLYLRKRTDEFNDIDIMTTVADAQRVRAALLAFGTLAPSDPDVRYKTRYFWEFTVDGVEIDVIAGFVIARDGANHDCPLRPEDIDAYSTVNGVRIPLHSMAEWRRYYQLMGRAQKVAMIDRPMP